jgi:hypothetical protein
MAPGLLRMTEDGPRIAQDARRMSKGLSQDAPRMAPGLLRMTQGGPRIAKDAPRMSQGLHQDGSRFAQDGQGWLQDVQDTPRMSQGLLWDAPWMATGLLRMVKDGRGITQDAPRMS